MWTESQLQLDSKTANNIDFVAGIVAMKGCTDPMLDLNSQILKTLVDLDQVVSTQSPPCVHQLEAYGKDHTERFHALHSCKLPNRNGSDLVVVHEKNHNFIQS